MFMDIYKSELTALFDSFIYHVISIFDYTSSLANFISGKKNNSNLMWTQLAKSVRDSKNILSKSIFAELVDKIDREFVGKMYDHRALLIHRTADFGGYTVSHSSATGAVDSSFYASKNLIKNFPFLKEKNRETKITIRYVSLWILKETIKHINDILFSLKEEIKNNAIRDVPHTVYIDPKTKEEFPVSVLHWHEEIYNKNK
jgi:hypothetical protein